MKHPTVAQVAALDADFSVCKGVHYAYGTFCDATHLLVTIGCALEIDGVVDTTMSKLGLIDVSVPGSPLRVIGKGLAGAYAGTGSSSYTVDCFVR